LLVYETLALAGSFVTGLLLGLAHPLTLVVLGAKWEGAAPIFAGFAAVALFVPLCSACSWLMTSQGRGHDSLLSSVNASGLTVLAFMLGIPYGPAGIAISYSISGLFLQVPVSYYIAGRSGPVQTRDLWASTIPYIPVWITVAGASWLIGVYLFAATPVLQLLVGGGAGLLCGALIVGSSTRTRIVVSRVIDVLRQFRAARSVVYGT
jgi:PST family polysaccharide transporter